MKLKLAAALVVAACAGTAYCGTIDFSANPGALGTSQVYGTAPATVTVYGYDVAGTTLTASRLFGKSGGGTEHGVGLKDNTPDHEISKTNAVQIDLANISGAFSLIIGSTQNSEGFLYCLSNTLGSLGSCTDVAGAGGVDPYTLSLTKTDRYISIEGDGTPASGNVLLDSLSYSPVPEPSSLLLFGTGILSAAGVIRRKLAA
ncbi:MAG: PEP-CTERM sorting domain-containing protein [Acidobacteriota bacterium]|nr:PEP-CTERM sorting domain-containing protein [Acidobacteriota bacterium]